MAGPVPSSAAETEARIRAIEALVHDGPGSAHDGRLSGESIAAAIAAAGGVSEVLNEADFASNSATLPPSQQSVAVYVASQVLSGGDISVLDARYSKPARLSPVYHANKSRDGQFRVALIGMSIASFGYNLPTLAAMFQAQYGNAAAKHFCAGALGGDYTTPNNGWEKQAWFGPKYVRLRGKAASTADQRFVFHGDTLRLRFSTEADSEAANITIDGEVVGTTPAAGTQAFGVLSEFNLTSGPHEVTIARPSGAGYVYFEEFEAFDTNRPGVIAYDWTLGGKSLISSRVGASGTGTQLAGVALASEHNGIDSYFGRDDVDLFIVMHDVNELHPTYYSTDFLPAFNRMIAKTRERPVPLVLISSMAGHFAMPSDSDYDGYAEIRALYAATRATESHVEHIDWHGATVLADIERYQQVYYPNATNLNVAAGTYGGDFIHPNQQGSRALHRLFTDVLHVPPRPAVDRLEWLFDDLRSIPAKGATRAATTDQLEYVAAGFDFSDTTDTFTTPTDHGLSVGDRVIFYRSAAPTGAAAMPEFTPGQWWVVATPTSTTFQLSATEGGAAFTQSGSSVRSIAGAFLYRIVQRTYRNPVEGGALWHYAHGATSTTDEFMHVPIYRDDTITSIDNSTRNSIKASDASDEWGTYYTPTAIQNVTLRDVACGQTFTNGKGCVLLFRFKGKLGIRAADASFSKVITPDGQDCKPTLVSPGRYETAIEHTSDEPIVVAVHVIGSTTGATVGVTPDATTRIYEAATVYGTVPVWPGDG